MKMIQKLSIIVWLKIISSTTTNRMEYTITDVVQVILHLQIIILLPTATPDSSTRQTMISDYNQTARVLMRGLS